MRPQRSLIPLLTLVIALAALASSAVAAPAAPAAEGAQLAPVKTYLLAHTTKLVGFTTRFRATAKQYSALAGAAGFDYAELWASESERLRPLLRRAKALWIEGNPYYERVEGVVAGTPSLAVYDVILDAGSSAEEDPASAVPFDLKLSDGRVLRKPGNLFNLTEGDALGHAAGVRGQGRQGRPRRRRPSSSSARCCPMRSVFKAAAARSPRTPASSTARRGRGSRRRPTRSRRSS